MFKQSTGEISKVLESATAEAHHLHHDFVGTEHILLGLLQEGGGKGVDLLWSMGLSADRVRSEIERTIHRGPDSAAGGQLPLTPRAQRVIGFAQDEARLVGQRTIAAEHLLLGLLREPDGVAGMVLRNLGLELRQVRQEVMRFRLLQMTIVERVVRPVRATIARKRKLREELLVHVDAIYAEEQARLNDPAAALNEAARRFGDPAELAREMEAALPARNRIEYYLERFFGWRAPESAARYLARLAAIMFCMMAAGTGLAAAASIGRFGWERAALVAISPAVAMLLVVPIATFVLGLLYLRMRDSIFGVFGTRPSRVRAYFFAAMISVSILLFGFTFSVLANWDVQMAAAIRHPGGNISAAAAGYLCFVLARIHGPMEISDTIWARLEV